MISYPPAGPSSYRPPMNLPSPETAPLPAARPRSQSAPAPSDSKPPTIEDNLRLLDEAASQYYADHDATTTTFEQLVGGDKYILEVKSAAGEDYRSLLFKKGRPLRLYLKDGRVIVYPPH